MEVSTQSDRPEDALRLSRPRTLAVRLKGYSPRLVEFARPAQYFNNLRLVGQLRDESYTMLGGRRARNLVELARQVDRRRIPGAIVDCGVWNGGSTILMGVGAPSRELWAFDSFEGLPKPGPRDPDAHEDWEGMVRGSEQLLTDGFARYARDPSRLHIVKGWFEDTLIAASEEIGEIAVLHIDADWYDSVTLALEAFYPLVVPGGFVAVDDLKTWRGAREATMEFRRRSSVTAPVRAAHYWRK